MAVFSLDIVGSHKKIHSMRLLYRFNCTYWNLLVENAAYTPICRNYKEATETLYI